MNQFQTIVSSLSKSEDSDSDEGGKQADHRMVSKAVSGKPVPDETQSIAGAAVHYGFGAFFWADFTAQLVQ